MYRDGKVKRSVEQLSHRKPHMRAQGAASLAKLAKRKHPHVIDAAAALLLKLQDESEEVQTAAAEALHAIIGEYNTLSIHQVYILIWAIGVLVRDEELVQAAIPLVVELAEWHFFTQDNAPLRACLTQMGAALPKGW